MVASSSVPNNAPPPGFQFTPAKSCRRNVRRSCNTTTATPPSPPQAPPSMEGPDLGQNKYVHPGRERVPTKIFDPSTPQQPNCKRGRPSTKRVKLVSCMSPKATGGDSPNQVETGVISPEQASPLSPPLDQLTDNQSIHPVTNHLSPQSPGFIALSSIQQQIASTANIKVENVTHNENEYLGKDISGGNTEPYQVADVKLSCNVATGLMVESQPTTSTRVPNIDNLASCYTNIVFPTGESQVVTSVGDLNIYNVNSSYAETLKPIFEKHGDIAKDCVLQSSHWRTSCLEAICKAVQELQSKKLSELDYGLLNSYYLVVNDGEVTKLNVKWFRERLDEIRIAIDSQVESQRIAEKIAEKMEQLEDKKRDLSLKKIEFDQLEFESRTKENLLALETLLVDEMKRKKEDLEGKFMHFQDLHLMDGVL